MSNAAEQQIIALTHEWTRAFQSRDVSRLRDLTTDDYFAMIGVGGRSFQRTDKTRWLEVVPLYETARGSIDDMAVQVLGDVAIVHSLYTQEASIRGQDRSGQFVLTDLWVRRDGQWKMAQRLSSRPEPAGAVRPG
jgi:ketosteroid isomerase-like protein